MYLVRKHNIDYIDPLGRITKCTYFHVHISNANVHQVPILHTLKKIVNSIVSETLLENIWGDCNVDDVLYVLDNP